MAESTGVDSTIDLDAALAFEGTQPVSAFLEEYVGYGEAAARGWVRPAIPYATFGVVPAVDIKKKPRTRRAKK